MLTKQTIETPTNLVNINKSRSLQRSLIIYSGLGIFLLSIFVSIVSILPLYQRLKKAEERNLEFVAENHSTTVDQYLSKAKDIALQIGSRFQAKRELQAYNQNQLSLSEYQANSTPKLSDALKTSSDLIGISRFDNNGNLVIEVGKSIPSQFRNIASLESQEVSIQDVIKIENDSFLLIKAPILSSEFQRIGTDIILFETTILQNLINNYVGLGETGETVIGTLRNGNFELLFPLRNESASPSPSLISALEQSLSGQSGLLMGNDSSFQPEVIAYSNVSEPNWGLAVKKDQGELYALINRRIMISSVIIVLLSLLGTTAIVLIIRPLINQAITVDDLEQEINEKTLLLEGKTLELQLEKRRSDLIHDALVQMGQLRSFSQEALEQSLTSGNSAKKSLELAKIGSSQVEETLEEMIRIKQTVETINTEINNLSNNTEEIANIANLVRDFANQTNLLALNASVEAVRAGEQGAGFAVVADEIRNLADQSRDSADQIQEILGEIEKAIDSTVKATSNGTEAVNLGFSIAQETVTTFNEVRNSINEVANSSQQISLSNQEQTNAIEYVVHTINEIEKSSFSNIN